MSNKPTKSTTDSWLISAGIKTLPGVEKEKPTRQFGRRCATISESHRLSIYQEIKKLIAQRERITNPQIYDALADLKILDCPTTGQIISLGTIAKYTTDIKAELGIVKRPADIDKRFAKFRESGLTRSAIMRELSLSVYGYDKLLKTYKTKKGEQSDENNY